MTDRPSTCVIGAGVSGLTALKSLGDWEVPHTCFEASDDVGGNWYFRNPNGRSSAYRSLHIDTSKNSISFAMKSGVSTGRRYAPWTRLAALSSRSDSA